MMDSDAASRLDLRIRLIADNAAGSLTELGELITEAKAGHIHLTLGFRSWTAYIADALANLQLAMTPQVRQELVDRLAREGMSQRAIAQAVGVSQKTVDRDLDKVAQVSRHDSPVVVPLHPQEPRQPWFEKGSAAQLSGSAVTGIDGKTYPKPSVTPERKPRPRRPITDAFVGALMELRRATEKLERLSNDDRFDRNTESLSRNRNELTRYRDSVDRVIGKFDAEAATQ